MCGYTIFIGIWICILTRLAHGQSRGDTPPDPKYIDEAGQIFNTIFHKYKETVPPRRDFPHPVPIGVHLRVEHVKRLDTFAQILESVVQLEVLWKDTRLSWYPLAVKEITISQDKIWSPTISINNAVEPPGIIDNPKFVIKSSGDIYSYKRLQLKTFCATNLSANSADCRFVIGMNLLDYGIIDFDNKTIACDVGDYASAHDLVVEKVDVEKSYGERKWLKENGTFPEVVCTLSITRQEAQYGNKTVLGELSNQASGSGCCNNCCNGAVPVLAGNVKGFENMLSFFVALISLIVVVNSM